jgi:hypothetical protein
MDDWDRSPSNPEQGMNREELIKKARELALMRGPEWTWMRKSIFLKWP